MRHCLINANSHLKGDKQGCNYCKDHIEAKKNQKTKYDVSIISSDIVDYRYNNMILYILLHVHTGKSPITIITYYYYLVIIYM
jgi:hypothetical protein